MPTNIEVIQFNRKMVRTQTDISQKRKYMASKHMKRYWLLASRKYKLSSGWVTSFHAFEEQTCKNNLSMTSIGNEESDLRDLLYTADGNVNWEKFNIIYWSCTFYVLWHKNSLSTYILKIQSHPSTTGNKYKNVYICIVHNSKKKNLKTI